MTLPTYHTSADGTIPCTNACGKNLHYVAELDGYWLHLDGTLACDVSPYEGQCACPEAPNDCDPDFYDKRGWARQ